MNDLKPFIILLLIAIVASLGRGLFHMTSGPEHSAGTVRALTVRISLSVALFVLLFVGWYFGLIAPHEIGR
jgi:hypothetical protein